MKILFVTDMVYSESDPNLNLIKSMLPFFEKDNEVYFMGYEFEETQKSEFSFTYLRDYKVLELYMDMNGCPLWKKLLKAAMHPVRSMWAVFKLVNIDLITLEYRKLLRKLDKKYRFDAVVSISAPFYTSKALAAQKISGRKYIMMFDPYGRHYEFGNWRTRLMEKRAFAKMDGILMPKLLKKHYPDPKIRSYEFPAVVPINPEITEPLYDPAKINLAFVGSLYADIRSPEYLYELLKTLGDDRYHLTIVGGTYGVFPREFHEKYSDFINEHVTVVGKVAKEKALQYLWQADVLVNIGNRIENMLPSKVLEYISTGKPVLNIAQLENCPSLPYFEKYGNAMSIYSGKPATDEQLQQLRRFLEERSTVPEEKIRKDFHDATPEYVAKQLIEMVK